MTRKESDLLDKKYAEILKGLAVPIHAEPAMDRAIELLEQEPKMMACPSCGLDVHSDFKFCPRCGADMRGDNEN